VGDQASGKTSLIRALLACERGDELPRTLSKSYHMTINPEVSVQSVTIPAGCVEFNIIDAAGLTNTLEDDILIRHFVNDPEMLFAFVFDVNSPSSAGGLEKWWKLIEKAKTGDRKGFIRGVVIGAKCDLPEYKGRREAERIAKEFARKVGMDYHQTSAVIGASVEGPFKHLAELMVGDE
ncbi:hypothetical protein FOL47_001336, partial [Perkinsus chesapeaki]